MDRGFDIGTCNAYQVLKIAMEIKSSIKFVMLRTVRVKAMTTDQLSVGSITQRSTEGDSSSGKNIFSPPVSVH